MTTRDTAERQLARLLQILPRAAREGGVEISALCELLGEERERVLADVAVLAERAFYLPAGTGDDFQVAIDGERVEIWTKGEFQRPVRLTPVETLCVALGLRGLGPDAQREALVQRLESRLSLADTESLRRRFEAADLAPDPEGIREVLAEALRVRTPCRFGYLKPGRESPEIRRLEIWTLVHAEGHWYAVGRDVDADAPRAFRLDRVLAVEPHGDPYEIPADVDPGDFVEGARLFFRADPEATPTLAVVRYSAAVTPWIRERWQGAVADDGRFQVEHAIADPGWVVRHVLQYGADAELIEPRELRDAVRAAALRVCDAAG